MSERYKPEPFDLGRPAHLLAKDLLRRIGDRNKQSFGSESHADVEQLVRQVRDARIDDYESVLSSYRRNVREIDVTMHGEDGAAKQASLCDLMGPIEKMVAELSRRGDRVAELEGERDSLLAQKAQLIESRDFAIGLANEHADGRNHDMQRWFQQREAMQADLATAQATIARLQAQLTAAPSTTGGGNDASQPPGTFGGEKTTVALPEAGEGVQRRSGVSEPVCVSCGEALASKWSLYGQCWGCISLPLRVK